MSHGDILDAKAFGLHVLAVAVEGGTEDWGAYIGEVPGKDHKAESRTVAAKGSKLPKRVATAIFPMLDPKKYRV